MIMQEFELIDLPKWKVIKTLVDLECYYLAKQVEKTLSTYSKLNQE